MNKITTMVAIMSAAILAAGIGLNTMATPAYAQNLEEYAAALTDSNICWGGEGDDDLRCTGIHQGSGDDEISGNIIIVQVS
jgi:hypothetical protein